MHDSLSELCRICCFVVQMLCCIVVVGVGYACEMLSALKLYFCVVFLSLEFYIFVEYHLLLNCIFV